MIEVLDFRELKVDELRILAEAMAANPHNAIFADFGAEFRQMLAAHAGKVTFLRELRTETDFSDFEVNDLKEAETQFRSLAKRFKTEKRTSAQRFCQIILVRCKGGLEAQEGAKSRR